MKAVNYQQPWISRRITDTVFILLPPFFSLALVIIFPGIFQQGSKLSDAWWVLLILLIDVAHVYSTLYRTYFDKQAVAEHRNKLLLIPFIAFVAMVLLYSQSSAWFWRVLAYIAVYHFIRQQYGFMRVYSRQEPYDKWNRMIDAVTVYSSTIYPVIYWHLHSDRNFNWFTEGDFFNLSSLSQLSEVFTAIYVLVLVIYLLKEIIAAIKHRYINLPKNAVITGTALSWYFGIVYYNGDMAFTLLNVVSHGIPYMALVWMYGKKRSSDKRHSAGKLMQLVFSRYGLLLFLGIIFVLAFIEEGLWDLTLWKEHTKIFRIFHFTDVQPGETILSLIVPLLALPQVTHYILDGFIWRIRKNDFRWNDPVSH